MKIMIVEDHPKIREELSALLRRYGYETCAPSSFDHIVEAILQEGADLILLDINLPLFDGYYICREELSALLRRYGYETCAPSSFDHIVEAILQEGADLILLDINLPLFDGYYICREVRKASAVPIIIVTSRDSETDELMSMNLGADDFITKPYNTQILLAHIASVLKRAYRSPEESAELSWNGVSLSLSRSAARCGDRETELSKNETRILHVLIRNRDTIVSRDVIMNELWQSNEFVDDNTLTVNINRLRKKLAEIGAPDYIVTKRGQGYTV